MQVECNVEEFVSRCTAIVVCYYHFARTWKDWAAILGKIQALSEEADALEVSFDSVRPLLFVELSDRFDRDSAERLTREFSEMYAVISASRPATVGHF